jgi:hypothetical protein
VKLLCRGVGHLLLDLLGVGVVLQHRAGRPSASEWSWPKMATERTASTTYQHRWVGSSPSKTDAQLTSSAACPAPPDPGELS